MTSNHPRVARNGIYRVLCMVLVLLGVSGARIGQAAPPGEEVWIVPDLTIQGCQELWLVDGRAAPWDGDLGGNMSSLRFYRAEQHGLFPGWTEYAQGQFLALADASLPTTYFVHGYGLGRPGAVISGERVAEYMGEGSPPFRMVLWLWPARHRLLATPAQNVREKVAIMTAHGYYLASLVRQMDPDSTITLAGHSFGARSVLSSLQAMAVGHVNGVPLPPDFSTNRRLQTTLLAPAVSSFALSDAGEFFLATTQTDRLLVTVNEDDVTLNLMARITGEVNIMGLTGPYQLPADSHVYLLDANPYLGSRHRVSHFLWSGPVATSLQPFLIYYEAAADVVR